MAEGLKEKNLNGKRLYSRMFFILKGLILDFTIIDILSMGASISTMIGLLIAIVSLWNYYGEKREKLEYEVKKYFFDGKDWKILQEKSEVDNDTHYDVRLHITNSNFHHFAGEIKILKPDRTDFNPTEEITIFNFKEIQKDQITIEITQANQMPKGNILMKPLGTALLKYINPQVFEINFNENCLPNLPRTACLMKILT